jgi:hypothetical protein
MISLIFCSAGVGAGVVAGEEVGAANAKVERQAKAERAKSLICIVIIYYRFLILFKKNIYYGKIVFFLCRNTLMQIEYLSNLLYFLLYSLCHKKASPDQRNIVTSHAEKHYPFLRFCGCAW